MKITICLIGALISFCFFVKTLWLMPRWFGLRAILLYVVTLVFASMALHFL